MDTLPRKAAVAEREGGVASALSVLGVDSLFRHYRKEQFDLSTLYLAKIVGREAGTDLSF